jgi:hypothetical protein
MAISWKYQSRESVRLAGEPARRDRSAARTLAGQTAILVSQGNRPGQIVIV